MAKGPILFDIDEDDALPDVTKAPPVPDPAPNPVPNPAPQGQAMQAIAQIAARPRSRIAQLFWSALAALIGAMISVAAWDFVMGLIARAPALGYTVAGLVGLVLFALLTLSGRELIALRRLARVDDLRSTAENAQDLQTARDVTDRISHLYQSREEMRWGRERFAELQPDQLDADSLFALAETELLAPLDRAAEAEVQAAARQVATVTALVPLALADVIAALTANLRMIRRIAEVYGGRGGLLSSWRLTRAVLTHLVATGAVAVGDDMLEPILGGSLLGKLSRRFGEGLVNGALTARVGVAAIEVCRPLPFSQTRRPKASTLVKGALTGLFSPGK